MAVKRRVIWMTDAEWTQLLTRATNAKISASRAIVKALDDDLHDWEAKHAYVPPYVGPPRELTPEVLRAMGGSTPPADPWLGLPPPNFPPAVMRFGVPRPAPKPGKGR